MFIATSDFQRDDPSIVKLQKLLGFQQVEQVMTQPVLSKNKGVLGQLIALEADRGAPEAFVQPVKRGS